MDPVEYLRAFRRRWPIVAAALVLTLGAGWLATAASNPDRPQAAPAGTTFQATTLLLNVGSSEGTTQSGLGGLSTAAALATVGEVPRRAANKIGFEGSAAELASQVQASANSDTLLLSITASATAPKEARQIADTFAAELIAFLRKEKTTLADQGAANAGAAVEALGERIEALDAEIAVAPDTEQGVLEARKATLESQRQLYATQQEQLAATVTTDSLLVIQDAVAEPITASGFQAPRTRSSRLLVAGVIGLLAGLALVLVLERFDTRIRTKEAAERHFGSSVLAVIPNANKRTNVIFAAGLGLGLGVLSIALAAKELLASDPSLTTLLAALGVGIAAVVGWGLALKQGSKLNKGLDVRPSARSTSPFGDTFRLLAAAMAPRASRSSTPSRQNHPARGMTPSDAARVLEGGVRSDASRQTANGHRPLRTLLVTSAAPSEGKSTVTANLAASYAELGKKVVVLSCDFHRPVVHELLGVENGAGLVDALKETESGAILNGHVRQTDIANVKLVSSGSIQGDPETGELLSSPRMRAALDEIRFNSDIVLIDTPPLLTSSEATLLANEVDGVLVVARAGRTTADLAKRTGEYLRRIEANVVGVALNGSNDSTLPSSFYRGRGTRKTRAE